jgi:prepilin-type N-terminal cleavage/methylation domain-containing protein
MNKKGFTLVELLVVLVVFGFACCIVIGGVVGCCMLVKGANAIDAHLEASEAEYADKMANNPPKYAVGDIVYHKASDAKMVVANNTSSWNNVKQSWDIKVKDGGALDKVGGWIINETEVKPKLKEVGK